MSTVREITYDLLRGLGMTTIFGNPGSSELPFLKDMPADFRYVLALHERSAVSMAHGYSMARGDATFVNLHSIASAGHGLAGIIDAHYCHAPLVITTGQQDRRQVIAEPFLVSRAVEVVKPYVKWSYEPLRAEDVPQAIARGYALAMQAPKGPVFLSIPMDDWNRPCDPLPARKTNGTVLAPPAALDEIARAIESSEKRALIAGSQIEEDGGWEEVVRLAEHLDADVYDEPIPSRWAFPRSHPLFRGGLLPAQKPLSDQLSPYDVVLVLGAPVFLYYSYVPGSPVPAGTKLFQVTNSPADASASLAGVSIVGNVGMAAQYLRNRVKPAARRQAPKKAAPPEAAPEYPITPAYVFSILNRLLPPDAILAEECPSSKGDLDRHIRLDNPGSFYSIRSGILGFGLPAAVGLQLGRPDRRVVAPLGDGSAQYSIQALWTAAQQGAPVIFLVLQNRDYSALRGFAKFTKVGLNVPGMEIQGIDAAKLAQGYGMASCEVDRPEELEPALKEALSSDKPRLIAVNVQRGGQKTMGMDLSVNPPNYG